MPLEATVVIIDNSEYMRNGDYPPTRFDAQADAVNHVFQTKSDSNPENSVGVMTMAGKGPEVLLTHTRELGALLHAVHSASTKIGGAVDFTTAINVAQLALKHRQNKNLRQRIIVFLGSPLQGNGTDEKSMTKLAKKLKKNNIAIDVVCFGDGIEEVQSQGEGSTEGAASTSILKTFVENACSADNSHYVSIPPDPRRLLSDAVISSAVLAADRGIRDEAMADITNTGAGGSGGGGGGGGFDDLGIDPNLDPELAMALRMSLEEDMARRAAQAQAEAAASGGQATPRTAVSGSSSSAIPSSSTSASLPSATTTATINPIIPTDDDEDAALQAALALSRTTAVEDVDMHDEAGKPSAGEPAKAVESGQASAATGESMDEDVDEEEAIARAIQMSMQSQDEQKK